MSKRKNKRIWKISVIEICQRCNWVLLFPYLKWLLDLFSSSVRLFSRLSRYGMGFVLLVPFSDHPAMVSLSSLVFT